MVGFTYPHGADEKENFTPLCQVKVLHAHNSKLIGDFFPSLVHENLSLKPNVGVTRSEKVGLKLNIQKTKIMTSGPITSWQIDGETVEIVSDFIFLSSKITTDGDCSYEIKRRLLLGRKVMTNWLWFFLWSHMDVRVGLWRRLSAEELMLLNCGVGEDSWGSLGLQGDSTSPS